MKLDLDDTGTIHLVGNLDIHSARDLHRGFSEALKDRNDGVTIDLSGVTEIDTAGVQVLLALKRKVSHVQLQLCPEPIREWLERTGFSQLLA